MNTTVTVCTFLQATAYIHIFIYIYTSKTSESICKLWEKGDILDSLWGDRGVLMMWFEEEWRQRDGWTSPGSRGYVPGKVGLLCPREGRGICCIANWWSLVNCRVGRKLELTNQTGLFQRSWQLQYRANLKFRNITDGVSVKRFISFREHAGFSRQSSENTVTSPATKLQLIITFEPLHSSSFQSPHAATAC